MIKRTLYFGNPAYLSLKNSQLVVRKPEDNDLPSSDSSIGKVTFMKTIPVEDIGVLVLDCPQITLTNALYSAMIENNVALVHCNQKHMPVGLTLPLACNTVQTERFRHQLEASLPLRKQMWQQTVQAKIHNQARVLYYTTGKEFGNMTAWEADVRSGDTDNLEARAAVFYWKTIFPDLPYFVRGRDEDVPNNHLNYGYAILRAVVARALVAGGLLPTLGIHHHNRYNAYCLADDVMEPYRPYVDKMVYDIYESDGASDLMTSVKTRLLNIPVIDVDIDGHRSPLMIAVSATVASLVKCYRGESRKIIYPEMK